MNSKALLPALCLIVVPAVLWGSPTNGDFDIPIITLSAASGGNASDGSFTLTIDPGSTYDRSLDNGTAWRVSDQPPASDALIVTGLARGNFAIAVRDAAGDVFYPGYTQVGETTRTMQSGGPATSSVNTFSGATEYDCTTVLDLFGTEANCNDGIGDAYDPGDDNAGTETPTVSTSGLANGITSDTPPDNTRPNDQIGAYLFEICNNVSRSFGGAINNHLIQDTLTNNLLYTLLLTFICFLSFIKKTSTQSKVALKLGIKDFTCTCLDSTTLNAQISTNKLFLPFIFSLLFLLPVSVMSQCPGTGCTITITGSDNGRYHVFNGDKVCFGPNANFTGSIVLRNGELINCATAPQTFSLEFITTSIATINNYGTLDFTSDLKIKGSSTTINNYGSFIVNGTLETIAGSNVNINNHGALDVAGDIDFIGTATVNNHATITVNGNIDASPASNLFNYAAFSSDNLFLRGKMTNSGTLTFATDLGVTTTGLLTNTGEINTYNWTTNGPWSNSGFITASNNCLNTSVGTISGGCISCNGYTSRGPVTGTTCGTILVAESSYINDSGGALLGNIAFVDATPPATAPFIDISIGIIGPDVVWSSCTASCGGGSPPLEEICGNGLDDDGDGYIDCADDDCPSALPVTRITRVSN